MKNKNDKEKTRESRHCERVQRAWQSIIFSSLSFLPRQFNGVNFSRNLLSKLRTPYTLHITDITFLFNLLLIILTFNF